MRAVVVVDEQAAAAMNRKFPCHPNQKPKKGVDLNLRGSKIAFACFYACIRMSSGIELPFPGAGSFVIQILVK
jgi:hypothetical protein